MRRLDQIDANLQHIAIQLSVIADALSRLVGVVERTEATVRRVIPFVR